MIKRTSRMIEYRRAEWTNSDHDLELLIRQSWTSTKSQLERTVERTDGSSLVGLSHADFRDGGFALHCVRYTDGQGVGKFSMEPQPTVGVLELPPSPDENFLTLDIFALIQNNNVISLGSGRNSGYLREFLFGLIKKLNLIDSDALFDLCRVGDYNKILQIEKIGVKSIRIRTEIDEASYFDAKRLHGRKGVALLFKESAANFLTALSGSDSQFSGIKDSRTGNVELKLNVRKGDLDVTQRAFDHLAKDITDDDESTDYIIDLRNNDQIKMDEISLKKKVFLDKKANTINEIQAWSEMRQFMEELRESGQIRSKKK